MFNRKNGRRIALAAGVATVLVASLNPPAALADNTQPSLISFRNSSDPHVEGCATFDSNGVQHDFLCMYTSSDLNTQGPTSSPFFPMDTTYVYTFDLSNPALDPANAANWVDRSATTGYPAFKENWLPYSQDQKHLWAPTAHFGTENGEQLLYVPDVYPQFTIPTASQDGHVSYIAVASTFWSDKRGTTANNAPWGPFRYKKEITWNGGAVSSTYMSDPAVATLAGTHPVVDGVGGPATWLLWANGDNFNGGPYCGGLSIGMLNDNDPTDLVDNPARAASEITINGIGAALGVFWVDNSGNMVTLNHPYMEGPELYDLTQVGVPLPTNPTTHQSEPYALFFAAKPTGTFGDHASAPYQNQVLAWASASSPKGPYTYRGILMDSSDKSWTNHGSITASTITVRINNVDVSQPKFIMWFHDETAGSAPHNRMVRAVCLQYSTNATNPGFVMATRPTTMPNLNSCTSIVP